MTAYSGIDFLPHVSGSPELSGRGFVFLLGDLKGWDEGAPDATTVMDHWSGDGSVGFTGRLGARTIEVTGTVLATPATMKAALNFLQRPRRGVFDSGGYEANAQRTSLELTRVNASTYEFSLYLRADDPLRYLSQAEWLTAGAAVELPNDGDSPTLPTVTIVGPVNGLAITHPGGTWVLNRDIGAGEVWEAVFREGDLWWGGFRQIVPSTGPSPRVPIGGATWTANYTGAGQVSVRRYEAWT